LLQLNWSDRGGSERIQILAKLMSFFMTEDNGVQMKAMEDNENVAKGMPDVQQTEAAVIELSTQVSKENILASLLDNWDKLEKGNIWYKTEYISFKWKLAMQISDRFESKNLFGRFLKNFKQTHPNHALCTINPSTFYRYACAARFCDKFQIDDFKKLGLSPTVIYSLSQKANESVVDHVFIGSLKNITPSVAKINQLISDARSIITGELTPEPGQSAGESENGLLTQDFERLEAISNTSNDLSDLTEEYEGFAQPLSLYSQQAVSCIEPTNQLTEDEMVRAVVDLLYKHKPNDIAKKTDDTEPHYHITHISFGDPVSVTVKIRTKRGVGSAN
jgi:hypothetical protein